MIRLYLDSNVIMQMKNNQLPDFEKFLDTNKQKFSIFYSTAHIGYIYASYDPAKGITDAIKNDLSYISSLTNNQCFYASKNKTIVDQRAPSELFEDRIESEKVFKGISGAQAAPQHDRL